MKNVQIVGNEIMYHGAPVGLITIPAGTVRDNFLKKIQYRFMIDADLLKEKLNRSKNEKGTIELSEINDIIDELL
jgi:hypothetical protein